jgi:hypothetical protein
VLHGISFPSFFPIDTTIPSARPAKRTGERAQEINAERRMELNMLFAEEGAKRLINVSLWRVFAEVRK